MPHASPFRLVALALTLVVAACGDDPTAGTGPFTIGGTITGLDGDVTLSLNGNSQTFSGTPFSFSATIAAGGGYAVLFVSSSTGQTCTIANPIGVTTANVTNVAVVCTHEPVEQFTIGGTITGLDGDVTLSLNTVSQTFSATPFSFTSTVITGAPYAVQFVSSSTGQTCTIGNSVGFATANVTNVAVVCTHDEVEEFTIGGTITGLTGGVTLSLNTVSQTFATTPFTFTSTVITGAPYAVQFVSSTTSQTCTIANGVGLATANVTNVAVACTGGTAVSGDTIAFGSEWAGATGESNAALLDASSATPWNTFFTAPGDGSRLLRVIPVATAAANNCAGWPGNENVLEVRYQSPWAHQLKVNPLVPVQAGDTVYTRIYTCVTSTVGSPPGPGHWFHWHNPYVMWWETAPSAMPSDSSMTTRHYDGVGNLSGYGNYLNQPVTQATQLKTHRVYRFEMAIMVNSLTSLDFNIRIYDSDNNLAFSGADFIDNFGEASPADSVGSLTATFASGLLDACAIEVGNNDNPGQNPNTLRYIAAVACRVGGGWIGAYPAPGEGS